MTRKWIVGGVLIAALLGGGTAIAIGASGDDKPLTGSTLDKAAAAALAATGGGTIVETEVDDGGAGYEVGIRLEDGRQVEVSLDQNFEVIGQDAGGEDAGGEGAGDQEGSGDQDGGGED